jgi:hypothetical protein
MDCATDACRESKGSLGETQEDSVVCRSSTHSVIKKSFQRQKKKKRLAGKKDNMEPRKRGHDGSRVSPDAGGFVLFCAHIIRSLPENITMSEPLRHNPTACCNAGETAVLYAHTIRSVTELISVSQ